MRHGLLVCLGACALLGCSPAVDTVAYDQLLEHQAPMVLRGEGIARTHVVQAQAFQHVGLWLEGHEPGSLEVRARDLDGAWRPWRKVHVTWSEGILHVGRVILSEPTRELEVRGGAHLGRVSAEFFASPPHNPERLTVHMERATSPSEPLADVRVQRQALAPASLVISRKDWGARTPDKVCGSVVTPYRMSIHHTASPDSDGGDPAARMRQMQAFHIDNRGWCDIGYHFVVSQSGKVYQGRSDEQRPGAHVGNQNAGNIGVSFIGNYSATDPPQEQLDAAVRLMSWVKETYDIPWNRESVRGHREWPGQSTGCPGDNLLARIDDLMDRVESPTPVVFDVGFEVLWEQAPEDRNTQGDSAGVPDALESETLQAAVYVRNTSGRVLRGVKLRYEITDPYLQATHYAIETDAPSFDGTTFMLNDANDAPENPEKDALGVSGALTMYAFGVGETKRVLVDLDATQYSAGQSDVPGVRAWVENIDEIYTGHEDYDAMPQVQKTSALLRGQAPAHVLDTDRWTWERGVVMDAEGWSRCEAGDALTTRDGALVVPATTCVTSSPWTAVDTDIFNQLVLSTKGAEQRVALDLGEGPVHFWVPEGDAKVVVPVGSAPGWSGMVDTMRLTFSKGTAVSEISFQSGMTQETSSEQVEFFDMRPVTWVEPDTPDNPDSPDKPDTPDEPDDDRGVVATSCAVGTSAPQAPLWLSLLGLVALRRRRKGAAPW